MYISPLRTPIVHVRSFLLLAMAKTITVNSNETISVDEKALGKSLLELSIIVPGPLSHGYQRCQFVCWDFVILWIPHAREPGKRGSLDFKRLPPNASESPPLNGPLLRLRKHFSLLPERLRTTHLGIRCWTRPRVPTQSPPRDRPPPFL